jgi:hypothetical protein
MAAVVITAIALISTFAKNVEETCAKKEDGFTRISRHEAAVDPWFTCKPRLTVSASLTGVFNAMIQLKAHFYCKNLQWRPLEKS